MSSKQRDIVGHQWLHAAGINAVTLSIQALGRSKKPRTEDRSKYGKNRIPLISKRGVFTEMRAICQLPTSKKRMG